ncbi:DNA polymerase alpha/epsilon subunit B-domain-containing protein [Bombardia bombarda]|uniref:DNA-directed DNA polymerase n=1 Tax=Bombardia bombarda TaxID=252184 RepID=A0AA39XLY2_9PEZI|nr:DNA polymerase alpha/epsilon subunit B-domain-containing protein [Bombardia bombarda]
MVTLDKVLNRGLLQKPSDATAEDSLERSESNYKPLHSFVLSKDRQYQQQFADIYFLRLTKIKPAVEEIASAAWEGTVIGGEAAKRVDRVLDVRQGEPSWVTGTVYMDMHHKPNILEDVAKDRWISASSSVEHYFAEDGTDSVTLEDDSGRIHLVGDALKSFFMVTGCIVAVLGTENANGEFDVIDVKFADLPPQPERWALSKAAPNGTKIETKSSKIKDEDVEMADSPSSKNGSKIAIVSGLEFSGVDTSYSMELNLLLEYLLGEALDSTTQEELSHISRLIIAGNSIGPESKTVADTSDKTSHKKYGYDSRAYDPIPSQLLDEFLSELLPTMPITLLPGVLDPANTSYPQQPIHAAMFPKSKRYVALPGALEAGWLDTVTNPWDGELEGWKVLGTGGQNLDDVFKYVDSDDRLGMMEAMCRWRCSAPTAPDTLWTYPFQEDEPFVLKECPHLYFVGCQPKFGTKVIEGLDGQMVRLITVPSFSATRELVLVDSETLDVSRIKITTT